MNDRFVNAGTMGGRKGGDEEREEKNRRKRLWRREDAGSITKLQLFHPFHSVDEVCYVLRKGDLE